MPGTDRRPVDYLPGAKQLTDSQRVVCDYTVAGLTAPEIAAELSVTEGAVRNHITQIYDKLGVIGYREMMARIVEELLP